MKRPHILAGCLLTTAVLLLAACQAKTPIVGAPTATRNTTPVTTAVKTTGTGNTTPITTAVTTTAPPTIPVEHGFFPNLAYTLSWHAGDKDVTGQTMYGTETMRILPYKGKLYASTSMWMESNLLIPKACQLLVLDNPESSWRLVHQFTTLNLRLVVLQTVTFTTDRQGKKIEPVTMLLTAPDVFWGDVQIFSLDDKTEKLVPMVIGNVTKYATTRAIGLHRDNVTGIDMVFAGNDVLGAFSGGYDVTAPGRIKWQSTPEFIVPTGERVMGYTECNGVFYVATSKCIFKRNDGAIPTWEQVFFDPAETSPNGIRGLTAVQNPSGDGQVLLFFSSSKIRRYDPEASVKQSIELDLNAMMSTKLGVLVKFSLVAYNDFLPYTIPGTGEKVYLFGGEFVVPASVTITNPERRVFVTPNNGTFAAEGFYLIRHDNGIEVSYELTEVKDASLPALVSVRTIAISPFPADKGRVLYFGGWDCNYMPAHNTGWIYRATLP